MPHPPRMRRTGRTDMSNFFIRRVRFAMVVSILISIVGWLSLNALPVQQYPEISPPTINVTAVYPGADAQTIAEVVGGPVETAINGVEGMMYMSSTSSNAGMYSLAITFAVGTDSDLAQVNVQNRLQLALSQLPSVVQQQGVSVSASSPSFLMALGFYNDGGNMSRLEVANYVSTNIVDTLARVPGVGSASVVGASEYSMRVWLDIPRMNALGVTADEVRAAIQGQNLQASLGQVGAQPAPIGTEVQYSLLGEGRMEDPDQFANIVLRSGDNRAIVRLGDVTRIELGAASYAANGKIGGAEATMLMVNLGPGANAIETQEMVVATLERLKASFPAGLTYEAVYDATLFVNSSVSLILTIFVEAFVIVMVITFLFLQDWRATLVSGVAIPVSILGAMIVLLLMGYSLNTISLLAMVLAIGLVVDDAILVVENVQHVLEHDPGLSVKQAAMTAMSQITGPIVSTTFVLLAVVVPTSFLPGINGQMFQQFAVTLSASLVMSAVVALTLTPALAATVMRAPPEGGRRGILGAISRFLDGMRDIYGRIIGWLTHHWYVPLLILIVSAVGAVQIFGRLPATFLPDEDQGALFVNVQLPDAASLQRTQAVMDRVQQTVEDMPGVQRVISVTGFSLLQNSVIPNGGMAVVSLTPWEERTTPELQLKAIQGQLMGHFLAEPEAQILVFAPPSIPGMGAVGGLELRLQALRGQSPEELAQVARSFITAANQQPEIGMLSTTFSADVPQLFVTVDRDRAESMGVSVAAIYSTIGSAFGNAYVNDFTHNGRVFQVTMSGEAGDRAEADDLLNLYVRSKTGAMVPLRSLISVENVLAPYSVTRYNLSVAAPINGQVAPGYSSGDAMAAVARVAAEVLPEGYGYEWTGLSYQEQQGGNELFVYGISLLFAYLFLVALYERWTLPISIVLSLAAAMLGAAVGLLLFGQQMSLYVQIALVLLIGLAAKNAILIVEFAKERRDDGMEVHEAARRGAEARFRAVLMTALAFIFGVLPLAYSSGAGAGAQNAVGIAVVFGMVGATVIGLFIIPSLYFMVEVTANRLRRLVSRG